MTFNNASKADDTPDINITNICTSAQAMISDAMISNQSNSSIRQQKMVGLTSNNWYHVGKYDISENRFSELICDQCVIDFRHVCRQQWQMVYG